MIVTHKLLDCNDAIVTHKLLDCNDTIVTHKLVDCNEKIVTHKLLDCNDAILTHKLLDCNEMIVTHKLLDCNDAIVTHKLCSFYLLQIFGCFPLLICYLFFPRLAFWRCLFCFIEVPCFSFFCLFCLFVCFFFYRQDLPGLRWPINMSHVVSYARKTSCEAKAFMHYILDCALDLIFESSMHQSLLKPLLLCMKDLKCHDCNLRPEAFRAN